VCDIIFQERGNQFDHEVVDAFGEVVGEIVEITRTISMSGVDKKPFSPFSF
jgi:HD-GYP domain-containing protein (c-di-GMP phosphodiesterase class II)